MSESVPWSGDLSQNAMVLLVSITLFLVPFTKIHSMVGSPRRKPKTCHRPSSRPPLRRRPNPAFFGLSWYAICFSWFVQVLKPFLDRAGVFGPVHDHANGRVAGSLLPVKRRRPYKWNTSHLFLLLLSTVSYTHLTLPTKRIV